MSKKRKQYSQAQRARIVAKTYGMCFYCGVPFELTGFHIEHILPLSRGGTDDPDNLVAACPTCNILKGSMTVEEYRNWLKATNSLKRYKGLECRPGLRDDHYFAFEKSWHTWQQLSQKENYSGVIVRET